MDKELVIDYMAALACLYGVVRKRQVVKIYNEQNQDQISFDDVEAIILESTQINNYTHVIQEYIVRDYLNDIQDVEELSSNIIYSIPAGTGMNYLIQTMIDNLPGIDSETNLKNVADVIMNLTNNTRASENKGNTSKELSKKRAFYV